MVIHEIKRLKYLDIRKDKLLYRRRVLKDLVALSGKDIYYRQLLTLTVLNSGQKNQKKLSLDRAEFAYSWI
jgi:hypothetical protein